MNKLSKKFVNKFLADTGLKEISGRGLLIMAYYYAIDSRYRATKRLNYYLKEQVDNPHEDLVDVARMIRARSKSPDDLIIQILKYVNKRVTYVTDQSNFNQVEKWAGAYDAWKTRRGDCDDQNCLIYVLARLAGISDLVLWSAIGDVKEYGHYWNIYFSTKKEKWYSIDSTYHPDLKPISQRQPFGFSKSRYVRFWGIFNEQHTLKQR